MLSIKTNQTTIEHIFIHKLLQKNAYQIEVRCVCFEHLFNDKFISF